MQSLSVEIQDYEYLYNKDFNTKLITKGFKTTKNKPFINQEEKVGQ